MKISLAFHVIGFVMWGGGMMLLTRILNIFTEQYSTDSKSVQIVRKITFGWVLPGFALSLITGLFQVFYRGAGFYMQQGWFHGKLTLLIVFIVVTVVTLVTVRSLNEGAILSRARLGALHGISSLCVFGIILLTMLGRVG